MGLRCVAACILDEHHEPCAAVSISGPVSRIPEERAVELGALVMRTTRELTLAYGGYEKP